MVHFDTQFTTVLRTFPAILLSGRCGPLGICDIRQQVIATHYVSGIAFRRT